MVGGVRTLSLTAGELYRDLDGSLVNLIAVENDLCYWTWLADSEDNQAVTHRDNFVRRFRPFHEGVLDGIMAA